MPLPLRITHVAPEPLETLPFLTIPPGGDEPQEYALPFYAGSISGLPTELDAVVVASDLQGVVRRGGQERLLGQAAADTLAVLLELYFPHLRPARTLALLSGDLYADLTRRGQSGNPLPAWQSFAAVCGQVVGIAGNHDDFGGVPPELPANAQFLDNGHVSVHGLLIAGLSGIIGRSDKPFRRSEADYLKALANLLRPQPALLLTHPSPAWAGYQGEAQLTALLAKTPAPLLCCGHSHWPTQEPLTLPGGTQVLNADTKVYILLNAD